MAAAQKEFFPWQNVLPNDPARVISNPNDVALFHKYPIRGLTLKNRTVVSPMCTYSSKDGFASDWHVVHLSQFAFGGASLVFTEATAVAPEGRITPFCTGIWKDEHIPGWKRVTDSLHAYGAAAGIQIAHAGRKASTQPPFYPRELQRTFITLEQGGWEVVGVTDERFNETTAVPHALTISQIKELVRDYAAAAERAVKAGFDVIEIHGAHGYLISTFNSPLVNTRTDEYGGSFEGRTRFVLEIAEAVRKAIPATTPLFVRLSSVDGPDREDGWSINDTVRLAQLLQKVGVDVVDCSSGGVVPNTKFNPLAHYQVPYAEAVRKGGVPSMAVGMITDPKKANEIIATGQADLVAIGRGFLHNPRWTETAAKELGVVVEPVRQYRWTVRDLPPTEFVTSA